VIPGELQSQKNRQGRQERQAEKKDKKQAVYPLCFFLFLAHLAVQKIDFAILLGDSKFHNTESA